MDRSSHHATSSASGHLVLLHQCPQDSCKRCDTHTSSLQSHPNHQEVQLTWYTGSNYSNGCRQHCNTASNRPGGIIFVGSKRCHSNFSGFPVSIAWRMWNAECSWLLSWLLNWPPLLRPFLKCHRISCVRVARTIAAAQLTFDGTHAHHLALLHVEDHQDLKCRCMFWGCRHLRILN